MGNDGRRSINCKGPSRAPIPYVFLTEFKKEEEKVSVHPKQRRRKKVNGKKKSKYYIRTHTIPLRFLGTISSQLHFYRS